VAMDMLMGVFVLVLLGRHSLTSFLLGTFRSIADFHWIGLPTLPTSHPLGFPE
jgi:hypothetical protein